MKKTNHVSKFIWWLVIGILLTIDGVQILLNFFVIGLVANRIIDIFVALFLAFFLLINGQLDMKRSLMLGASFFAEGIPLVDTLPFWVLDGYYSMKIDMANKKAEDEAEEAAAITIIESTKQAIVQKQIEQRQNQALQEDIEIQNFNQITKNNTQKNDGRSIPINKGYSETKNQTREFKKVV